MIELLVHGLSGTGLWEDATNYSLFGRWFVHDQVFKKLPRAA
jgi:hypothetical protein